MDQIIPYLVLGILALIGAGIIYKGYYLKKGIYKKCISVVCARVKEVGGVRTSVVYEAQLDGKPVTFSEKFTTKGFYAPTVGETVELFYDPNNIERFSYPKRSDSFAGFFYFFGGLLIVASIFGMIMYTIS